MAFPLLKWPFFAGPEKGLPRLTQKFTGSECEGPLSKPLARKESVMNGERFCAWMSGPRHGTVTLSAAKWWFAISRDLLANDFRRQNCRNRPPVTCNRTPTFVSPLAK